MQNENLTFNDLPQVVAQLRDEVMGMRAMMSSFLFSCYKFRSEFLSEVSAYVIFRPAAFAERSARVIFLSAVLAEFSADATSSIVAFAECSADATYAISSLAESSDIATHGIVAVNAIAKVANFPQFRIAFKQNNTIFPRFL